MPLYTYKCFHEECETVFEVHHSMDEVLIECKNCGNKTIKKIPSSIKIGKSTINNNIKQKYNDACDDAKEDLKIQKEELKSRTWKPQ